MYNFGDQIFCTTGVLLESGFLHILMLPFLELGNNVNEYIWTDMI